MKRTLFSLAMTGLILAAIALYSGPAFAQGNGKGGGNGGGGNGGGGGEDPLGIGYRVFWPEVPQETAWIDVREFALATDAITGEVNYALVVGLSDDGTNSRGYVYDYSGTIDPDSTFADPDPNNPTPPMEKMFWHIEDLVGPTTAYDWVPATHVHSVFNGINSGGRIVGYVAGQVDGQWDRIGFYIDLSDQNLQLKPLDDIDPAGQKVAGGAIRVNELGEILLSFDQQPYIYSPGFGPRVTLPFLVRQGNEEALFFNSVGNVLAKRDDGVVVRHTLGGGTEEFPNANDPNGINEYGEFVGSHWVAKGKNKGWYAARFGNDGSIEWKMKNTEIGTNKNFRLVKDINNAGDFVNGDADPGNGEETNYLVYDPDPTVVGDEIFAGSIDSLIIEDSDTDGAFRNAYIRHTDLQLSDRDIETDFGWMAGTTDSGAFFLLIPEILP